MAQLTQLTQLTQLNKIISKVTKQVITNDDYSPKYLDIVLEREPELTEILRVALGNAFGGLGSIDQFSGECVKSNVKYGEGYHAIKSPESQIDILRQYSGDVPAFANKHIPNLYLQIPSYMEGVLVIPPWHTFGNTYYQACCCLLEILETVYSGCVYLKNHIDEGITQTLRKSVMIDKFREKQGGGSLLIPWQFGKYLAGSSGRRARHRVQNNQFCMGLYENLLALITHPERLGHPGDLGLLCAGDRARGPYDEDYAPYVSFDNGELTVAERNVLSLVVHQGVATGQSFLKAKFAETRN